MKERALHPPRLVPAQPDCPVLLSEGEQLVGQISLECWLERGHGSVLGEKESPGESGSQQEEFSRERDLLE